MPRKDHVKAKNSVFDFLNREICKNFFLFKNKNLLYWNL